MSGKAKKIIILVIIIILLVIAFFAFKNKNNNGNGNVIPENTINKLPESENIAGILDNLKKNYPELSDSQLAFYRETARNTKEIIVPCEKRSDANDCIASVAFIKSESSICGEIENQEVKNKCVNVILKELAAEKIDKCWSLDDGHGFATNCLRNVFAIYNNSEDCQSLESTAVRQVCEGIFYYEIAFISRDAELCKKITNEKLNQYCYNAILPDSDKDGLPDIDEAKLGTNSDNPDTDGDGYKDGEEVKSGYNPLGK